ncbi:MBL fold metallo-hydrolase [Nocardiopsis sp. YSL2]|uniref:MBL fold metallo-hydrolase n=1 Tax=Nocardiopsis sp. YSL2 TaxID=2939492 RepID=UPI0026F445D8|nr:MBL fold metallo-hydrolase [Nocardiopsis sp. YSL2]
MPDVPPVEDIGDGVWSLPVPIPGNPLGFTYVYLLTGPEGPVLVDTGWNHDESWDALVEGVKQTGHTMDQIRGAVLTHFHPDHTGLVGRLREHSDAWTAMHPADIAVIERLASADEAERADSIADQLLRAGFPAEDLDAFRADPHVLAPPAVPDRVLADGATVDLPGRDLRAVWTPGHTPGHLCLHLPEDRLLFTGDHVLPRITPHVGQFPLHSPDGDPLGDFLRAQEQVGRLPDADRLLCLPAHETRFRGTAARAAEITAHHEERLDQIAALLDDGPATLWELTTRLPWRRPWADMRLLARHMAASETAAHLRTLEERRRALRTDTEPCAATHPTSPPTGAQVPRWGAVHPPGLPA